MRPLRIAFVGQKGIPAHGGGVETHVEAVARRLAARGHDVVVYVRRWYTPPGSQAGGVRLRWLPTLRTKHLDAALHSAAAALHATLSGADVVHFHAIGPSLFCWLPRLSRSRVVSTVHALDYLRPKWASPARLALRLGEQLALRASHRTLVVSQDLARHYRARGWETEALENGVERGDPRPPNAIRALGLSGNDYLLCLGRWDPSKRIGTLIDGYRKIERPGFRLVVAGEASSNAEDRAVRSHAQGAQGVLLPGAVDGELKAELLSNALGFVTVSELEGLPIALLEAMSHGLPCLASDIPSHREVLGPVAGARLRRLREPAEIAGEMEALASLSPDERAAMGRSCRRHVRDRYDWEPRVDRLEALYRELVP